MGFAVTMLGRSLDGCKQFANAHDIRLGSLSRALPDGLDPAVVVQATPLGGLDKDPDERPLPDWQARPGVTVLDMVYRPQRTRFLRDAEEMGAQAIGGLEMFVAQAEAQVRRFTDGEVPAAELRAFLAGAV
jgi:shikimate dehydrogenase